jgi:hypothetical protein
MVPPSGPSRECAADDCRRAVWLLLAGEFAVADEALTLALGMMRAAHRLDDLRGDRLEVS